MSTTQAALPSIDASIGAGAAFTSLDKKWWDTWAKLEAVAVFLIGFGVMQFIYSGTGGVNGNEIAVPGNDDFYHIKMSALIPEFGLVREFPWLQYSYFTKEGHDFVSHHYGFHTLMVPFLAVSKWLTQDYLAGGRAATSTFFALWLMIFNLILQSERVRWRWLWLIAFLLLPSQFFGRHTFIRAISPSLMFMFLIIFLLFRRRYIWAAVAIAAYTHLYLGAVMFSPVIVACCVAGLLFSPRPEREIPWKMTGICMIGWAVGLVTYPYFNYGDVFEFLRLQVFGTGLTADIPVGQEWKPYDGVWWFAQMCGPLLGIWFAALWLRTRWGPRFDARESAVLLMNVPFLILCLKSRRFIEYWPAYCLLSSALIAKPIVNGLAESIESYFKSPANQEWTAWIPVGKAFITFGLLTTALYFFSHGLKLGELIIPPMASELVVFTTAWPMWVAVAGCCFLVPLGRILLSRASSEANSNNRNERALGFVITSFLFLAVVIAILWVAIGMPSSSEEKQPLSTLFSALGTFDKLLLAHWVWLVVLAIFVLALLSLRSPIGGTEIAPRSRMARASTCLFAALAVFVLAVQAGAVSLVHRQREARCDYNLTAIRAAMDFLKENSQAGDIVFTDDWDVFPVYFYYNHHNYYIVGLDPKFTHHRDPELWERYVQTSRGQVPTSSRVKSKNKEGEDTTRKIDIKLEDIREHFKAKWVVTDSDHKPLARKLANAPEFAELLFPGTDYEKVQGHPLLVFRIREPGEVVAAKPKASSSDADVLYLSDLIPRSVEQAWGEFKPDRSVEGGQINLAGKVYPRGLGTHARSRLDYDIPEGYSRFRSTVGINRVTGGRGSIRVSVELDGQVVFTSGLLTGDATPVDIDIELKNAKKLSLKATDGEDGNKYDHVDWADARLTRAIKQEPTVKP